MLLQPYTDAYKRRYMVPPRHATASPLVRFNGKCVVALVREAEDLFATVMVAGRYNPTHLMRPRVAPIADVLERDAWRDGVRTGQVARKLRAKIEDDLCLGVAGHNIRT